MFIQNSWKWVLWILPILVLLVLYFSKRVEPFVIVDAEKGFDSSSFRILLQDDKLNGGVSHIALLPDSLGRIRYRYTLNNNQNAALVRLIIESQKNAYINLHAYNSVRLSVQSEHASQLPVVICNAIPFHSNPGDINSYHLSIHYASVSDSTKEQQLWLRDFTTPDWWYSFNSNKDYQNVKPNVSLAKYLFFTNTAISKKFLGDTVTISTLQFEYDFTRFWMYAAASLVLYYLILLVGIYFPRLIGVQKVYLWYRKIDTVNYEETEKLRLLHYLQQHFHEADMNISDVQNATGIHQRKIAEILKKDKQLTFKAYLNHLRIEHAKKLLTDTDLPVSNIAFDSGYNSISHFNRVFKSELTISPQEFRLHEKSRIS